MSEKILQVGDNPFDGLGELFAKLSVEIKEMEEKFIFGPDIEYPIEINGVVFRKFRTRIDADKVGKFVSIRPIGDEYEGKTFLGLYLGDIPVENLFQFEKETKKLHIIPMGNPAIFVFDLNKVVYGCESWWGPIESEDQLRQITNDDIENIWYVKALKQIGSKQA